MGEVDAIGDAVSGALIAREVDAMASEAAVGTDGHTHEQACLNCGTTLTGAYCQACGQRGHVHRTLTAFFHDLLHSVFHFEGRFWNTLPMLAWRPGELTRRYVDGQRALRLANGFVPVFGVPDVRGGDLAHVTDQSE